LTASIRRELPAFEIGESLVNRGAIPLDSTGIILPVGYPGGGATPSAIFV
jgi:hypothetical protein